jgi:uracil-DNA glycosylase
MPSLDVGETLAEAAAAARACTLCAAQLPLGPRPTFRVSETARLLIVSQAPGTKVHATGIPFNDASGDRLRAWLGVDRDTFYDAARVALVPMGLCYPGRLPKGGDVPPMKVCAPTWHPRLIPKMPAVRLTLLVGSYAIARMLGPGGMAAHVRRFREYLPGRLALPHPSWRTIGWEAANPWFTADLLPELRARVRETLDTGMPAGG